MGNFLRNVCEAEKADPEHENTICISYDNLCELFKQHEDDSKVKIMKCPQCSEVLVEPEAINFKKDEFNKFETSVSDADWPEDFDDENGNYFNKCRLCECTFTGYKRRVVCKVCAKDFIAPKYK